MGACKKLDWLVVEKALWADLACVGLKPIFDFCEVAAGGQRAPLEEAKARARELFPAKPGWPKTTLVISQRGGWP